MTRSSWRGNAAFYFECNLLGRSTRMPRGSSAPLGTGTHAFERVFPCRRRVVPPGTLSNGGAPAGRGSEGMTQGRMTRTTKRTSHQLILEKGDW